MCRLTEFQWVLYPIVLLTLGSCVSLNTPQPPVSETPHPANVTSPTETAYPTHALIKVGTPNATQTALSTTPTMTVSTLPTPALPDFSGKDFYFGDFFFEKSNCSLPCWHGLNVNQSTEVEVSEEFRKTFGPVDMIRITKVAGDISPKDTYGLLLTYNATEWAGSYQEMAAFDQSSKILQMLNFHWAVRDSSKFEVHLSPQRVIHELGKPDHLLASLNPLLGEVEVYLVYQQGILFIYSSDMTSTGSLEWKYCFGDTQVHIQGGFIIGEMYLMSPIDKDLKNLSRLQDAIVSIEIRREGAQPAQVLFGGSENEIVERLLREQNSCFPVKG